MDYDDTPIPDFASILSGGELSVHETPRRASCDEKEMIETGLVNVEEVETESDVESESELESESESESESEPESESEYESTDDESASVSEKAESECESDDDICSDEYESRQASKKIDIGAYSQNDADVEHVYDDDDNDDEDEEDEEDEEDDGDEEMEIDEQEVCYEDTDLGGEDAATASLLAASLVAGGSVARSRTGWTWTSIFVVLSAAGGLGIVLLYAIKRINELNRLVQKLEENSHMALNQRDVQVITTQVIGDILQDSEIADNAENAENVTSNPDPVQAEFSHFVANETKKGSDKESVSELVVDEQDGGGGEAVVTEECEDDTLVADVGALLDATADKKNESVDMAALASAKIKCALVENRGDVGSDPRVDGVVRAAQALASLQTTGSTALASGVDDPDDPDDLADRVGTMSLSDDDKAVADDGPLLRATVDKNIEASDLEFIASHSDVDDLADRVESMSLSSLSDDSGSEKESSSRVVKNGVQTTV